MDEASKTKQLWGQREWSILAGRGIDIGSGPDPVAPTVRRFDMEHGDANDITAVVHDQFDYVFSSHCLEHLRDVRRALAGWWTLVKPGGHLFLIVPDEDLYEQGYWPSLFNADHKHTFTIHKRHSWSPTSHNLLELARSLEGGSVVGIELQDAGYRRSYLAHGAWPRAIAWLAVRVRHVLTRCSGAVGLRAPFFWPFAILRLPVDQTRHGAVAQIQLIVRKGGQPTPD